MHRQYSLNFRDRPIPGIIDKHIQAAKVAGKFRNQLCTYSAARQIGLKKCHLAAGGTQLPDSSFHFRASCTTVNAHSGAIICKQARGWAIILTQLMNYTPSDNKK